MASGRAKTGVAGATAAAVALGVQLALPSEGIVLYVYKDPIGVLTYCAGETENAKALLGKKFTRQECIDLINRRMGHYDQGNAACVANWNSLPVPVRGAFNSFSYNLGNATFCKSTAAKYLRVGRVKSACLEMGKFVRAGGRVLKGLVTRRAIEQTACLQGADA